MQQSIAATTHPKMEESDPSTSNSKQEVSSGVPMARNQVNGVASHNQGVDRRNLSCTESMVAEYVLQEAVNRKPESLRRMHLQQDWVTTQIAAASAADKRWTNEVKVNFQEALKEPVKVMQRPQSIMTANQSFQSTITSFGASSFTPTRRYPSGIYSMDTIAVNGGFGHNLPGMDLNGLYSTDTVAMNGGLGHYLPSTDLNGSSSLHLQSQCHYQPFASNAAEFSTVRRTEPGSFRNSVQSSLSSLLAAPSSLGLFSGLGSLASSGKSSTIDWTNGASMPQCDYASVDWSLDLTSLRPLLKAYPSLDTMSVGGKAAARPKMGGGDCVAGSQDAGGVIASLIFFGSFQGT
ncbi:uncharacterized protein M6B38_255750 [Iris pallida]|uniref:Uncharacterized protein n=1 Tax=Iris pallida TaxID=29817 RepID=A0AAX6IGT3_IRIPA|nr:uncharacterized protein M6B38_255750 [Iris pallida]